jgi:16S rRNA (guanine527-N7)-methyltransferase
VNLKERIQKDNIPVDENFFSSIQKFKEQLHKWNKIHNLTGAKNEEIMDNFIHDAVYPLKFLNENINSILDIGTGAGFPGMILAIARPNISITLVEPLQKRASFLQFVKADIGLKRVDVQMKRAEDLSKREVDLVTSRAVTDTKLLLEISKNLVNKDSQYLFYKGEKVFDEVKDIVEGLICEVIETEKRHYLLIQYIDG